MKIIKQTVYIDAKPEEVYEAYTDAKKHGEITGGKDNKELRLKFAELWEGAVG